MKTVLVTGSAGFIGGYIVQEFLSNGYKVLGIDNFSKYGQVRKFYDDNPNYSFVEGDCQDIELMTELAMKSDYIVSGAAMIGGITYFHKHAYDLLCVNERINAATFDAAIASFKANRLKKIIVMSSSMVFENTNTYPTPETDIEISPPPSSTYGFQKLACEFFAKGAYEQYGLPYTIVRPFNCVGIGEGKALSDSEVTSGDIKLAMSHVLPDLIQKVLKGQRPLHILGDGSQVRHYTHGKDLARGIRLATESREALNNDFNLSTPQPTTVLQLAKLVWETINVNEPFSFETDDPFQYDVQVRSPDTSKAKEVLGFEANISLEESVTEVIDWIRIQIAEDKF
jgi:UDP-glucose 4-epimerase